MGQRRDYFWQVVKLFGFFLFATFPPIQGEVKMATSIDDESAIENQPIKGTITVTHNENEKVDESSFLLEQKALKVALKDQVKISPTNPLVLTIYEFQIPPKEKGLHFLPSISATVDGKKYVSPMASYEVKGAEAKGSAVKGKGASSSSATSKPAQKPNTSDGKIVLRLEAFVEGKSDLYPSQRARLVYRYKFNDNIELTSELLPLLDAEGLIKISEKEIKDYSEKGFSVREISQEVEAKNPGEFSFGPSIIEGYAYSEEGGKRVYSSTKLHAEAPIVKVNVEKFPDKDKPSSFNGAVGKYTFTASLLNNQEIFLGDEFVLSVDISGEANLQNVPLPEICCQPGINGFFQMNDLPPVGEIHGDTKTFIVKMRPLNQKIEKIPSIEFSFFNPETKQYHVLHSQPIPITIKSPPQRKKKPQNEKLTPPPEVDTSPKAIEILGIFTLTEEDLQNKFFGSWWSLGLLPLFLGLFVYQKALKIFLIKRRLDSSNITSLQLFTRAKEHTKGSDPYFFLVTKALQKALLEMEPLNDVPRRESEREVSEILIELEKLRFSKIAENGDKTKKTVEIENRVSMFLNNAEAIAIANKKKEGS